MSAPFKKSLSQKEHGFTLIELIIVVVIIGILALVAIPRYFANIAKTQTNAVYANLAAINQALLSYYAVNGAYPTDNSFPITVTIDGETVVNFSNISSADWRYVYSSGPFGSCSGQVAYAYKAPFGSNGVCGVCTNNGLRWCEATWCNT
jgi:prepilin-type N-terminal cleavage/methylation domain-containing protein